MMDGETSIHSRMTTLLEYAETFHNDVQPRPRPLLVLLLSQGPPIFPPLPRRLSSSGNLESIRGGDGAGLPAVGVKG